MNRHEFAAPEALRDNLLDPGIACCGVGFADVASIPAGPAQCGVPGRWAHIIKTPFYWSVAKGREAMSSSKLRRILLLGLAGSLALCALFAIFVVVTGAFNELSGRIMLTTVSIGFYSLTGLCFTPHLQGDLVRKRLAYAGIGASAIGLLYACVTNWFGFSDGSSVFEHRLFFVILTIALAHISLLLFITPRNSMVKFSQYTTIACVATVGAWLLMMTTFPKAGLIGTGIPLAVLLILDALGSIVTPVLHIASRAH